MTQATADNSLGTKTGKQGKDKSLSMEWEKNIDWAEKLRNSLDKSPAGDTVPTPPTYSQVDINYKEFDRGYFVNRDGRTYLGEEKNKSNVATLAADGWAVIRTILELQTPTGVERSFVIACQPYNEEKSTFTITAKDASNGKILKAGLVNAFGRHHVGALDLKVIQALSENTKSIKLFDRPRWFNNGIAAPGLIENSEFDFETGIQIDFTSEGDADAGAEALVNLFRIFNPENVAIVIAAMIGAPVIAKLWPGERFATFLVGTTGTHKTAFIQLVMSAFGEAYSQEINIIRWGHGATANSLEHLAAMTGPFPFIVDNYKNYSDRDPSNFQKVLHALCEGGEKRRMTKDSGMRKSEEYQCMPIITGENYPGQDAASRARTVMLQWTKATDLNLLTEAQEPTQDINKLGQEFCLWLSSDAGQDQLRQLGKKFNAARSRYLRDTGDAINASRIATNAAIIALIWELLYNFPPTADMAEEFKEVVEEAIKTHITQSKTEVSEDLDAERFMGWLSAEIETGNMIVRNAPKAICAKANADQIGQYTEGDLLIGNDVFKSILIPGWQKSTNGAKADIRSLSSQLVQRGYLKYNEKDQVYTHPRRIGGDLKRAYVFNWAKVVGDVTQKQADVTGNL